MIINIELWHVTSFISIEIIRELDQSLERQ